MTTVALVLAAVSTLISLICFAALVEMFKSLEELQKYVEYNDIPKALPDAVAALAGHAPSEYGLPADLDRGTSVMLLLSTKCHTCARVAAELSKGMPDGLTVVLAGADEAIARRWLDGVGLATDAVVLDRGYRIVDSMQLHTTPAAVRINEGKIEGVFSIASPRALRSFVDGEPPPAAVELSIAPEERGGTDYAATG